VEGTAELHDPKVRAELNRRVRECERKCFAGGRLDSIQQARVCARQQATREQIKSQGCVDRGSSNREQEDLEVRGGVGLASQFDSIVSSHDPRPLSTSALRRHGNYSFGHLPPTATMLGRPLRHPRDLVIVELFSSPILFATGIHFLLVLPPHTKLPQGLP
jgi:hypothetical protein